MLPLVAVFLVVRLFNPAFAVLAVLSWGLACAFGAASRQPLASELSLFDAHVHSAGLRPGGPDRPRACRCFSSRWPPRTCPVSRSCAPPATRRPSRPILPSPGSPPSSRALFGAHTSNLAAISAAICTGPDTHPDPAKRWMVGPFYALCLPALRSVQRQPHRHHRSPAARTHQDCGGACASWAPLPAPWRPPSPTKDERFPAVLTLAVTASGLSLFGIGSAFWGLVAGLTVMGLDVLAATAQPGLNWTRAALKLKTSLPEDENNEVVMAGPGISDASSRWRLLAGLAACQASGPSMGGSPGGRSRRSGEHRRPAQPDPHGPDRRTEQCGVRPQGRTCGRQRRRPLPGARLSSAETAERRHQGRLCVGCLRFAEQARQAADGTSPVLVSYTSLSALDKETLAALASSSMDEIAAVSDRRPSPSRRSDR